MKSSLLNTVNGSLKIILRLLKREFVSNYLGVIPPPPLTNFLATSIVLLCR
jgi:hypothetical protein